MSASRIVEIIYSDRAIFESLPDEDLGVGIMCGEPGRLVAQATDVQIERLRQVGFEVNVLFDSVEAYVAAFQGEEPGVG
jgi:hypothetical protein